MPLDNDFDDFSEVFIKLTLWVFSWPSAKNEVKVINYEEIMVVSLQCFAIEIKWIEEQNEQMNE